LPQRGAGAYQMFLSKEMKAVAKQHPDLGQNEIFKMAAANWANAPSNPANGSASADVVPSGSVADGGADGASDASCNADAHSGGSERSESEAEDAFYSCDSDAEHEPALSEPNAAALEHDQPVSNASRKRPEHSIGTPNRGGARKTRSTRA